MAAETKPLRFKHGLSFLATLAFVGGFFGARIFHLLLPGVMIITQGGIHFHHFWYGLAMMGVSGWLGIVDTDVKFARIYAVVFGVGAGFVGDEVAGSPPTEPTRANRVHRGFRRRILLDLRGSRPV